MHSQNTDTFLLDDQNSKHIISNKLKSLLLIECEKEQYQKKFLKEFLNAHHFKRVLAKANT